MSDAFPIFATCPRGVEPLLAAELGALGVSELIERPGGVAGAGERLTAYRICLWSRVASRVLMPLKQFPLSGADALYEAARQIDWPELFAVESRFAIEVAGHSPNLTHTHFAALKLKDAVADTFRERLGRRPDVDTDKPDLRIHLYLDREQATISLDLAGDSLHRRGWRSSTNEAPLKENLAAAILLRAGWPDIAARGGPLLDPLCGSGTLVIEAALMAGDVAPGLMRPRYGFEAWLDHVPRIWKDLRAEAQLRREQGQSRIPTLCGADIDPRVLKMARRNAEAAGLAAQIEWSVADVSAARPFGAAPGLVVTNPPYGERLAGESEVIKLYSLLGAALKQHFGGWQAAVFTGRPDLGPRLGLRAHHMHSLYNGALPCKLLRFEIPEAPAEPLAAGGEDFANRLRKNLKHLAKWIRRSGVENYRVYDADLPDYAFAVDVYRTPELHLHVQEYAAPASIDPVRAEKRLREALVQLQAQFEVPAANIHYKLRAVQRGSSQYEAQDEKRRFLPVTEHSVRLWINLDDYLDTGLFLDHRPMRLRLQQEAKGKRFLNLFCYTGTASVHAAVGGAKRTVSVDLSNTYLEWAERNFELNSLSPSFPRRRESSPWGAAKLDSRLRGNDKPKGGAHELIRADGVAWLVDAAKDSRQRFDLIFCDPPTFSNSKKMEGVFDVERDHAELIGRCMALLAPGGTLYFSCNRRRFKLDEAALAQWSVSDITARTLDEDFRSPPPAHRCWQIQSRA